MVTADQKVDLTFDQKTADQLLAATGEAGNAATGRPSTMVVIYSCGDYVAASQVVRSDDPDGKAGNYP